MKRQQSCQKEERRKEDKYTYNSDRTDRQTGGQTDRQTDRQTDQIHNTTAWLVEGVKLGMLGTSQFIIPNNSSHFPPKQNSIPSLKYTTIIITGILRWVEYAHLLSSCVVFSMRIFSSPYSSFFLLFFLSLFLFSFTPDTSVTMMVDRWREWGVGRRWGGGGEEVGRRREKRELWTSYVV